MCKWRTKHKSHIWSETQTQIFALGMNSLCSYLIAITLLVAIANIEKIKNMKIEYKINNETRQDFLNNILKRINPTSDTGVILEKRIKEIKTIVTNKCGHFGSILSEHWPEGRAETDLVMPICITNKEKIDAVIHISVCLYDDMEFINNLTK